MDDDSWVITRQGTPLRRSLTLYLHCSLTKTSQVTPHDITLILYLNCSCWHALTTRSTQQNVGMRVQSWEYMLNQNLMLIRTDKGCKPMMLYTMSNSKKSDDFGDKGYKGVLVIHSKDSHFGQLLD